MATKKKSNDSDQVTGEDFPDLTDYPASEDIYNQAEKTDDVAGDDNPKLKAKSSVREEIPGDELDVPGAELDDADENVGEEDEENNYYSLGGDNHENLDEDKGD
jgi:hypothetical protein